MKNRSLNVWATFNNDVVNIREFSESTIKDNRLKFVCPNCGKKLIPNIGDKKNWYFRHEADVECDVSTCVFNVYAKVAFDILKECVTFRIPDTLYYFEKSDSYVLLEEYKNNDLNNSNISFNYGKERSLTIKFKNNDICIINFIIDKSMSKKSLNQYNKFIRDNFDKYSNIYVIEIDLKNRVAINSLEQLKSSLKESILFGTCSTVVASKAMFKADTIISASAYINNNDEVLCPVKENRCVYSSSSCRKCPFKVSINNGIIKCYAKTCLRTSRDLINLISDVDDIAKLSDYKSYVYDDLKDRYSNILDDLKPLYKTEKVMKGLIGNCKDCGTQLVFQRGDKETRIKGLEVNKKAEGGSWLYRVCPKCLKTEIVKCPKCANKIGSDGTKLNSRMKVLLNADNRVFAMCEHYLTRRDKENERTDIDECDFSVTLYTDENCNVYEDELRATGGFDNLYTDFDSVEEKLNILRGKQVVNNE